MGPGLGPGWEDNGCHAAGERYSLFRGPYIRSYLSIRCCCNHSISAREAGAGHRHLFISISVTI